MKHKNPFKGIACSNGSSYGPQYFRHIEGARDSRPAWPQRHRDELFMAAFRPTTITPFRDTQIHPLHFSE